MIVFRQLAAIDASKPWNIIHSDIQAATILGRAPVHPGTFCTHCFEADHKTEHSALQFFVPSPLPRPNTGRRAESTLRICIAWNRGKCVFPRCSFRHVCAVCFRDHRARDCPESPPESEYKRTRATPVAPDKQGWSGPPAK